MTAVKTKEMMEAKRALIIAGVEEEGAIKKKRE